MKIFKQETPNVSKEELEEFLKREAPELFEKMCVKHHSGERFAAFTYLEWYHFLREHNLVPDGSPKSTFADVTKEIMDNPDMLQLLLL